MTKEEGNKIIAEFMDCLIKGNLVKRTTKYWDFPFPFGGLFHPISELKYHTSWDWIIPVIQKANKLNLDEIMVDNSVMTYVNKIGKVKRELLKLNIETTWVAMVEFITWFNNKKQ